VPAPESSDILRSPENTFPVERPSSQLRLPPIRRAWGVTFTREMARHRLARVPLIAAALGTRLAQAFAPNPRAAGWDIEAAPVGPPGLRALHA